MLATGGSSPFRGSRGSLEAQFVPGSLRLQLMVDVRSQSSGRPNGFGLVASPMAGSSRTRWSWSTLHVIRLNRNLIEAAL
jgi:hypothetical protein